MQVTRLFAQFLLVPSELWDAFESLHEVHLVFQHAVLLKHVLSLYNEKAVLLLEVKAVAGFQTLLYSGSLV